MRIIKSRKVKKFKILILEMIILLSLTACSSYQNKLENDKDTKVSSNTDLLIYDNIYVIHNKEELYEIIDMINNGKIKDENPSFDILNNNDILVDDYIAFGDSLVNLDLQEITVEYMLESSNENASIYARLNPNTEVFNVHYLNMVDSLYAILNSIDIESANMDVKVTIQSNSDSCSLYIGDNIVTNVPFNTVIIETQEAKVLDLN